MAEQLAKFSIANHANLFLVLRGATKYVLRYLQNVLPPDHCMIATNDQPNPYPGILAIATLDVTSDSVNMASEAASTGKPVLIAYWQAETDALPNSIKPCKTAAIPHR